MQDLRAALRQISKNPLLSAAVVASLALGIGANTAVFSLVDTLLLRPAPGLAAPDRLVALYTYDTDRPERMRSFSHGNYLDIKAEAGLWDGLVASADCELSLTHDGPSERIAGLAVSDDYFTVLGVHPALGRLLAPEGEPEKVAVLSHELWQRSFAGDRGVVGNTVRLNGESVTIVGVTPRGFRGIDRVGASELFLPLTAYKDIASGIAARFGGQQGRKQPWLDLVARLAPGVDLETVRTATEVVALRLAEEYPEVNEKRRIEVHPLLEVALGVARRPTVMRYSGLMLAVVALVLLIATINVASLLVARALTRRREVAIRLSLGSSRSRLLRLLLTESLVLALLSGIVGVFVAGAALPLLERMKLPVDATFELALDARVLGFALLITLISGLLFGLIPAWQSARTELVPGLRGEIPRGRRFALRDALVALQVALAVPVLIGSVLMTRTLSHLEAVDPGFDPERTLAAAVNLSAAGYSGPQVVTFYEDLLTRLRGLPGVEHAAVSAALPMTNQDVQVQLTVSLPDEPPSEEPRFAHHAMVGPGYFATVGRRMAHGRDFEARDGAAAGNVVIVDETLARTFWPDRDPLGRKIALIQTEEPFEIVGVVADAKFATLREEAQPTLFLAHAQYKKSFIGGLLGPSMTLLVRTAEDPRAMIPVVRRAVQQMDRDLPVYNIDTLESRLAETVALERQWASLMSLFGLIALALTLVGLFGVLSHAVVRRTREIAIRVTCGASPQRVRRLVLGRSLVLAIAGIVLGLGASLGLTRFVASRLYGVAATDPAIWAFTSLLLVGVVLGVSLVPARRAESVDPAVALQEE